MSSGSTTAKPVYEHRPVNGFKALGKALKEAEKVSEKYNPSSSEVLGSSGGDSGVSVSGGDSGVSYDSSDDLNLLKLYNKFKPLNYGDLEWMKGMMGLQKERMEYFTSPSMQYLRKHNATRDLVDVLAADSAENFKEIMKKKARKHGWYNTKPLYGFPIISTLTSPIRKWWNGRKAEKKYMNNTNRYVLDRGVDGGLFGLLNGDAGSGRAGGDSAGEGEMVTIPVDVPWMEDPYELRVPKSEADEYVKGQVFGDGGSNLDYNQLAQRVARILSRASGGGPGGGGP